MGEMINIREIVNSSPGSKHVYFIGVGGIGMSALARYFLSKGLTVSGYDRSETLLTKELRDEGVDIHFEEDVNQIPKDPALVVYTPAIPADHKELKYYQEKGTMLLKRSDVLGAITGTGFNICIGGTHGKTTISTMTAHILKHTGFGCNAFLGGISVNYDTNFWSSEKDVCVIEADEYDRSFLKLNPDVAVISSMDADHLDIYGTEENMQDAFVAFGNKVKDGGLLISKFGLKRVKEINARNKLSYSLQNNAADAYATDIKINDGGYKYNVHINGTSISGFDLKVGGMHNIENSVAAIAVAMHLEIEPEKIKAAVSDFQGVRRRFEYILPPAKQEKGGYIYPVLIDDYAHHPEELAALLKSAKSLFPQRILTVIFQPHLYTRTRDLADGFAESLSLADKIVLLPIYPARELPIEGVTSEMILEKISHDNKELVSKEALVDWMKNYSKRINKEFGEVIITAGAGDIDTLVQPLKTIIEQV